MQNTDEIKFNEFKEMFSRYLDIEDLSEQEFELRCNMINFVKSACILTFASC